MAKVELAIDGPIARVTLNRPEVLNALDVEATDLLLAHFKRIERTPGIRAVIFTGAGRAFMAGADLGTVAGQIADPETDLAHEFEQSVVRRANEMLQVIERLPCPVISSVRGAVAGGGLGFALAADFVIASETAFFYAAQIMVGLSTDGGASWYLHRLVGAHRAKEILMLGQKISAAQALDYGIATRVVPDGELEQATEAFAQELAAMPAQAIANLKQLINTAPQHSFADHLQMEARLMGIAATKPDLREGVAAFQQRRKPIFNQA